MEAGGGGGVVWIGCELGLGLSSDVELGGGELGGVGSRSGRDFGSGSGSGSGSSSSSGGVGVSIGRIESGLGFGSGGMEIVAMGGGERGKEVTLLGLGGDNRPAGGSSGLKKVEIRLGTTSSLLLGLFQPFYILTLSLPEFTYKNLTSDIFISF